MPSITSWTRLEPQVRTDEMKAALQARVYDPLWMLARQWQVGEFQGEDNGSPVIARLRGETTQLTRYLPGELSAAPTQGKKFDPRRQPLEPLVEREAVRVTNPAQAEKFSLRAEAGLHFLRLIARAVGARHREHFISRFALKVTPEQLQTADDDSVRFLQLTAQRVPDGALLLQAIKQGTLLADPALNADRAALQRAAEAWLQWSNQWFSEPGEEASAWQNERLEYAFSVAAPHSTVATADTVLTAREYYEGTLDWYAFDVRLGASLGAAADRVPGQNPAPLLQSLMPAPVTFRGMPAQRFWEFEDATVDLGAIETAPTDLARMVLIEFALTYGNDWFVLPVELPVGALCQIASLVITDTFGERTLIPATSASLVPVAAAWRMYRLAPERRAASSLSSSRPAPLPEVFFLAPTLGKTIEGLPLEEVVFARDEMANLVWGIERTVEGATGRPINQRDAYFARERRTPPPAAPATAPTAIPTLTYRLATSVPDYWIPFVPVPINVQTGAIRLQRAGILSETGARVVRQAQSQLLKPVQSLYEEEVPREGIRVTRTCQLARWWDGATYLWIGRYKETGRGEASSGLQFDRAEETPPRTG